MYELVTFRFESIDLEARPASLHHHIVAVLSGLWLWSVRLQAEQISLHSAATADGMLDLRQTDGRRHEAPFRRAYARCQSFLRPRAIQSTAVNATIPLLAANVPDRWPGEQWYGAH